MTDDSNRRLVVLLDRHVVGDVVMAATGRLSFGYDEAWRAGENRTPLSLSMSLSQQRHGDAPVRAFLAGLLPDNERVLERWAREYQVSAGNPFALLRHVGEDCAGAAQFVTPHRVEAIRSGAGDVRWMPSDEIADRLRVLRNDPTAWHLHSTGQFSLAGAQAKTALHFDRRTGRWGEPSGATPTTHILKPAVTGLDDHDLNEHLCLSAARFAGLTAAVSQVASFGSERVIVVERFDRSWSSTNTLTRIHQEDTCQATGLPPTAKYQNDGGPTPERIIELLRTNVSPSSVGEDVNRFVDALAFNWIVGGTDAHAKNYSILLRGHQARLAPMYDVASTLVYDDMYGPKLQMAMKIGGEYRLHAIRGRHWRRFAAGVGLDSDHLIERVGDLIARVPGAFARAAGDEAVTAVRSPLPMLLAERVVARAADCLTMLRE